ncbi:MAG TPA: TetR/AcrR family transcriptional regulator [Myxococcota bacterium]|jgi:AcrR family transcriptional regulator|nr:TetR/AcrR family transcriptional regulator [Myxococcota bacterium]
MARPRASSSRNGSASEAPRRSPRAPDARARLVAAAAAVLRESGYRAASIEEVLARSGVAKSNLYYHFPSKLELSCAAVDHWLDEPEVPVLVGALADERRSGLERVRRWVELFAELSAKDGGPCGCKFGMLAAEEDLPEPLRVRVEGAMRSIRHSMVAALEAGIRDGSVRPDLDCERVALSILAAAQGGGLVGRLARNSERIVEACEGILALAANRGERVATGARPKRSRASAPAARS